MSEKTDKNPQQSCNEDEINLLDLLIVLAKHKKLIIGGTLIPGVVMAVFSLFMTPIYLAETKIYIPQSPSLSAQILSQLGPMASIAGRAAKSPNEFFIEMLKSRPVRDRIIERFELANVYNNKSNDGLRNALLAKVKTRQNIKSRVITLGIEDTDPKRAAALANAFVDEFRYINKELSVTEASQRRLFFEEQLKDTKDSLTKSEDALKVFQEKTGAVKIDAQASAAIEGIAQLRAQIAAKEVQLKVMRIYTTIQNPDIQRAEEELKGLHEQIRHLESKSSGDSVIVPTGNLPSTGTEYLRLMRNMKYNETLYGLLISQYQSAKLDEASDAIVVQVLEKAEPPEQRFKPRRTQMVIGAFIVGAFITIFVAFFKTFIENVLQEPENSERIDTLKRYLAFRWKSHDNE